MPADAPTIVATSGGYALNPEGRRRLDFAQVDRRGRIELQFVPQHIDGPIARPVVDHDHLELGVGEGEQRAHATCPLTNSERGASQ